MSFANGPLNCVSVRKAGRPISELVVSKPIWSGVRGAVLYGSVDNLLRAIFLVYILWKRIANCGTRKGRETAGGQSAKALTLS